MERQKRKIDIDKAKREKGNSESELGEESSKDSSVVESPMFEQQDEEAQQEEEQEAAEAATYRRNDFDRNEEIREHDDDQYPSVSESKRIRSHAPPALITELAIGIESTRL